MTALVAGPCCYWTPHPPPALGTTETAPHPAPTGDRGVGGGPVGTMGPAPASQDNLGTTGPPPLLLTLLGTGRRRRRRWRRGPPWSVPRSGPVEVGGQKRGPGTRGHGIPPRSPRGGGRGPEGSVGGVNETLSGWRDPPPPPWDPSGRHGTPRRRGRGRGLALKDHSHRPSGGHGDPPPSALSPGRGYPSEKPGPMISRIRGTPCVMFIDAIPAKWNVCGERRRVEQNQQSYKTSGFQGKPP